MARTFALSFKHAPKKVAAWCEWIDEGQGTFRCLSGNWSGTLKGDVVKVHGGSSSMNTVVKSWEGEVPPEQSGSVADRGYNGAIAWIEEQMK